MDQTRSGVAASAEKARRPVFFAEYGEYVDTPICDAEKLGPGMVIEGPAVVELPTTTIVVFPDHRMSVNSYGDLRIEIPQGDN